MTSRETGRDKKRGKAGGRQERPHHATKSETKIITRFFESKFDSGWPKNSLQRRMQSSRG